MRRGALRYRRTRDGPTQTVVVVEGVRRWLACDTGLYTSFYGAHASQFTGENERRSTHERSFGSGGDGAQARTEEP